MTKRETPKQKDPNKGKGIGFLIFALSTIIAAQVFMSKLDKGSRQMSIVEAGFSAPSPPLICVEKIKELNDSIAPKVIGLGLKSRRDTSNTELSKTRAKLDTMISRYLGLNSFIASPTCWKQLDGRITKDIEKIWVQALVIDFILERSAPDSSRDSLPPS